jgi:hypothetical protein
MTNRRGTITALDIQRGLHESASPREWRAQEGEMDGVYVIHLYANEVPIGTLYGETARADANLIVQIRNVLPEHILSFEHLLARVRYLEQRVRELEAQTKEPHG